MNIGIDIGGSHIAVGVVEDNKIILKKEHDWTAEEKKDWFKNIEIYSKKLIKEILDDNYKVDKIGIGFPAANIINGIVTKNGMTINLPAILFQEFNIPTYLKNDVKCSALCEKKIGSLEKYENCFFLTLGTGIGGAYFYQNEMIVPNKFQGFEIGHMVIEKEGKKCSCGRKGCFEQYASMKVFRSNIENLFNIKNVTSYKVYELIQSKNKEEEMNNIINEYISDLSIGLINIINIFEPDVISIGGSFSYYSSIFIERLINKIKETFKDREIPNFVIAKFENDSGIIGASMIESN